MTRIQLILALVATALGLYLLQEVEPTTPASPEPLTALDPQQVQRIELYMGADSDAAIVLRRQDQAWLLETPVQIEADALSVGEILRLASAPSRLQRPAEAFELAKLKLAPPLWRVRLDQTELQVGGIESISRQRYVRHQDTVHLVPDFNPAPLDGNYADLVSRQLLPQDAEILEIRLPSHGAEAEAGSGAEPMTPEQAWQLAQRWRQAAADWVTRPMNLHFDAVRHRVTVVTAAQTLDFLISATGPRLELIRPDLDLLYSLPGSASTELLSTPASGE